MGKSTINGHLVGGSNHLEKYESQCEGIPYIMENKKRLKPLTSHKWNYKWLYILSF
jgi:hypothetical protein